MPVPRRTIQGMVAQVTTPMAAELAALPQWVTRVRAPNPGPMTLDGTNTWILRAAGARHAIVVDPGPADEAHLAGVAAYGPIGLILVTHGHADHTDGLARLCELLGGVPVVAADPSYRAGATDPAAADYCAVTAPGGDGTFAAAGLQLRMVRTPGHTADSVSFHAWLGEEQVLLTGDTILGRGTTVVAWPDGDLADYLATLQLLCGFGPIPVLPGHGPALADCAAAAGYSLRHRWARLEQVRAARDAGAADAADVVARVYADVDPALWPAAQLSVQAQLAYLDRESS